MQLERECGDCLGAGFVYVGGRGGNDPIDYKVVCDTCLGEGVVEVMPDDIAGRTVKIPGTELTGECHPLFGKIIMIDQHDREHVFSSIGELELCGCL